MSWSSVRLLIWELVKSQELLSGKRDYLDSKGLINDGLEISTQPYDLVFSWFPSTENPQPIKLAGDSTIGNFF